MRIYIKIIAAITFVIIVTSCAVGCANKSSDNYNISNNSENDKILLKSQEPKSTEQNSQNNNEEAFEMSQGQKKVLPSPTPVATQSVIDETPSNNYQNFANEDSPQILDENGEPAPIDYYAYYHQYEVGVIGLHFHGTGLISIEVGDNRGSLALDEKGDGFRRYAGKWNDIEVLVIYQEDGERLEFYAADGELTKYNGEYFLIEDYQP